MATFEQGEDGAPAARHASAACPPTLLPPSPGLRYPTCAIDDGGPIVHFDALDVVSAAPQRGERAQRHAQADVEGAQVPERASCCRAGAPPRSLRIGIPRSRTCAQTRCVRRHPPSRAPAAGWPWRAATSSWGPCTRGKGPDRSKAGLEGRRRHSGRGGSGACKHRQQLRQAASVYKTPQYELSPVDEHNGEIGPRLPGRRQLLLNFCRAVAVGVDVIDARPLLCGRPLIIVVWAAAGERGGRQGMVGAACKACSLSGASLHARRPCCLPKTSAAQHQVPE